MHKYIFLKNFVLLPFSQNMFFVTTIETQHFAYVR